jgi:hypothetical protein
MGSEGIRRSLPVNESFRDLPSGRLIPDGVEGIYDVNGGEALVSLRFELGPDMMILSEDGVGRIVLLVSRRCAKKVLRLTKTDLGIPEVGGLCQIELFFSRHTKQTVKEEGLGSPTRTAISVPVSAVRDYLSAVERGAI